MTEQAIVGAVEAAAGPVVKALEPEAADLLARFKAYAESEAAALKAKVEQLLADHHTGLLGWLEDELSGTAVAADPTPAPEAHTHP